MRSVLAMTLVLSSILASSGARDALAARHAKVDGDDVELLRGPRPDAGVVLKLKKGQNVAASNYPTEGFYKIRTGDGTVGWVKADTLILGPMPDLTVKKAAPQAAPIVE